MKGGSPRSPGPRSAPEDEDFRRPRLSWKRESHASNSSYRSNDETAKNKGLEAPAMELSASEDSMKSTEVNECHSVDAFDYLQRCDDVGDFGSPETQYSALAEGDGGDEDENKGPRGNEEHRQSPLDPFGFRGEFVRSAAPSPEPLGARLGYSVPRFIIPPAGGFDDSDTESLPVAVSEQYAQFKEYGQDITDAFTDRGMYGQLWISQRASDFQTMHTRADADGDLESVQPMVYDEEDYHSTSVSYFQPTYLTAMREESTPEPAPSPVPEPPLVPAPESAGPLVPPPDFYAAPAPPPGFSPAPAGLSPSQFAEAAVTVTLIQDLQSIEETLAQLGSRESITQQIAGVIEEQHRQEEAHNYPWFTFPSKKVHLVRNWEYIVPYWGSKRDEWGRVVRRATVGVKSKLSQVVGIDEVDEWVEGEERGKEKRRMVREGKEKARNEEVGKTHVTRKKPWERADDIQRLGLRRRRQYPWCTG